MTRVPVSDSRSTHSLGRAVRALRGSLFFIIWLPYLTLIAAPIQRFIIWPLVTILPSRRELLAGKWLRLQARIILWLSRFTSGVRVTVHGALPDEPIVAVMNHQSVFDIPVALSLFQRTGPLIPCRDRYQRYIPVISVIMRILRFPFVSQRAKDLERDLNALSNGAARVASGEHSMLIYAEGHRTRDGQIGPFMRRGPRLILSQAKRPVYIIVADGMWGARTFTDALIRLAGSRINVRIAGPFPPPTAETASEFLDDLHASMVATLAQLRRESAA